MKLHILFVDDEPRVLQGLRRMLRSLRAEWDMHFVGSGPEALDLLEELPIRVVVSDMRMPGMNGAELLGRIMDQYPHVVRIALSGESKEESVLRAIGPVHQYLTKPCDMEELKGAITRTAALQTLTDHEATQSLLSTNVEWQSPPPVYARLLRWSGDADSCMDLLTEAILEDGRARRRLLQLVRAVSPSSQVAEEDGAQMGRILGLGLGAKALVALHSLERCARLARDPARCDEGWAQGVRVGIMAREICRCERVDRLEQDDALAGGLLIHLASWAIAEADPVRIEANLWPAEVIFTTGLLAKWAMPAAIVEVAAYHRYPQRSSASGFSALTAVHIADAIEHANMPTEGELPDLPAAGIDMDFLDVIGVRERLPIWIERATEALRDLDPELLPDRRRTA